MKKTATHLMTATVLCLLMQTTATCQTIETTMTLDLLDRTAVSSPVDGVIASIGGRAGALVTKDQLLVQIETERRKKELKVAHSEHKALLIRSKNDTLAKVNEARERSAAANLNQLHQVRNRYQVSVPMLELTRAKTELQQASFERKGATQEMSQFRFEAQAKLDEAELLKFDLEHSSIHSRYDGAVINVEKQPGEFVRAGDTIIEVYRLDQLAGLVLIDRDQLQPENAVGQSGKFEVPDHDGTTTYDVAIVRVLPRLDVDGKYRAFVEINNQKTRSGSWKLLPGLTGVAKFKLANQR